MAQRPSCCRSGQSPRSTSTSSGWNAPRALWSGRYGAHSRPPFGDAAARKPAGVVAISEAILLRVIAVTDALYFVAETSRTR